MRARRFKSADSARLCFSASCVAKLPTATALRLWLAIRASAAGGGRGSGTCSSAARAASGCRGETTDPVVE